MDSYLAAKANKHITYLGKVHKRCGTTLRRTSSKKCIQCEKEYHRENAPKLRAATLKWQKDNLSKVASNVARYYANKKNATPSWLSEAQLKEIDLFYEIARWYSIPMEVDHIIPLNGKLVSGLHVPWNLQLLTRSDNAQKSNKLLTN